MKNTFTVSGAIDTGWKLTKANPKLLSKVMLTIGILQLSSALLNVEHVATSTDVIRVLLSFAAGVLSAIFMVGFVGITLRLVRGQKAKYEDIVPSWHTLWRFALVSILVGIFVVLGFILLIVPGIYLMLRFSLARHVIVDSPETGIFDALHKSTELTEGIKWELFGLILVLIMLNILGALALGLGLLVTVPLTLLSLASVYVSLVGKAKTQAA